MMEDRPYDPGDLRQRAEASKTPDEKDIAKRAQAEREISIGLAKANAGYQERLRAAEASGDQTKIKAAANLRVYIEEVMEHVTVGATAWDIISIIPRRDLKQEDCPAEAFAQFAPPGLFQNRERAEGTISSLMSKLHLHEGVLSWDGKEERLGGYGVARRVYHYVPPSERPEPAELRAEAEKRSPKAQIKKLKAKLDYAEAMLRKGVELELLPEWMLPKGVL